MPAPKRFRSMSLVAACLVGAAVLAPPVVANPVLPARTVPDAPTVHVATGAEVSALQTHFDTEARARARGVAPKVPFDPAGFRAAFLRDINNVDAAVGYGLTTSHRGERYQLTLLQDGSLVNKGVATAPAPQGDRSAFAQAINDDGVVTGEANCDCRTDPPGTVRSVPFRWSATDGFTYAPMPAGFEASGVDINDEGVILIQSWAPRRAPGVDGTWLWDPNVGTLERLPDLGGGASGVALDNDGTVVGSAPVGGVNHAVRWGWGRQHRITDLAPGSQESQATDINQDGTIVGWQGSHAVAWLNNGRRTRDLGEGRALAINDDDAIAGTVVLAHLVADDGSGNVDVSIAAVYDLWSPEDRAVVDTPAFAPYAPVRLNDDGMLVNDTSLYGPANLS